MLSDLRRILTLLILTVFVAVPALARAQQQISATAPRTHETSRFSHGCDATGEKVAVTQPAAAVHVPGVADEPRETVRTAVAHADDPVPRLPLLDFSTGLRAPPLPLNV